MPQQNNSAREKLIVALDVPTVDAAHRAAGRLRGHVGAFKVGLELFCGEGPGMVRALADGGDKVFLDLKLHDIPNTVRAAARQAAQLGAAMMTVHASGGRKMMEAALEGAGAENVSGSRPLVLAVTVLTSLSEQDLEEIGFSGASGEAVLRLALLAQAAGLDGVVASPREIAAIREACGARFVIVTPGIRPSPALSIGGLPQTPSSNSPRQVSGDDQSRVSTPFAAVQAGADYLVVGRPIMESSDPGAAADAIVREMEKAAVLTPA